MSWAEGGVWTMAGLIALGIAGVAVDAWLTRRRDRKWFRITPNYSVGADCKERRS